MTFLNHIISCSFIQLLLFYSQVTHLLDAITGDYSSVYLDKSWSSKGSTDLGIWEYEDSSVVRPILLNNSTDFIFGFGFFSNRVARGFGDEYYLTVFLHTDSFYSRKKAPTVLWCANTDYSVSFDASLEFHEGYLQLKGMNGTVVWSTNTIGPNSAHLNLSDGGNLKVVNNKDTVIWQSFDYPTDTWVLNQNLSFGNKLTSRKSSDEMNSGLYSLHVNQDSFVAYVNSNPPESYVSDMHIVIYNTNLDNRTRIETSLNHSLSWFKLNHTDNFFKIIRLEPDGRLYVYRLQPDVTTLILEKNIFTNLRECDYPNVCGNYGICSGSRCTCPNVTSYFTQIDSSKPNLGCALVSPLSCNNRKHHSFIELNEVSYFNLESSDRKLDEENCKKACLYDCSCKAVFISDSGLCSLKSDLYSLKKDGDYVSSVFIKVQDVASRKKSSSVTVLASVLPAGVIILFIAASYYYYCKAQMNSNDIEDNEDDIRGLKRFSLLELKSATDDFNIRLGRGGFGSVFKGELGNGTKVAVKCLESVGQGRKEFLAEVNTIGSTNHFNLVRLIGYCSEKSNRLLVYEHMYNGSLDKWIFNCRQATTILSWKTRSKIIIGIAKGLEYLHVQCNPNIIHFDIKPQNILLDEDFNAKISDFGLAKLIDRDQSQVCTRVKGTPGYVAPELFGGTNISVKADVFSFGIVILEIVFGRKNFDPTQSYPLIDIVKEKAENGHVEDDLVDLYGDGIRFPKGEASKMIKIAIWCLQAHNSRPSMSTVLNVLEGLVNLESIAEYRFTASPIMETHLQANLALSTPPMASDLSGPR